MTAVLGVHFLSGHSVEHEVSHCCHVVVDPDIVGIPSFSRTDVKSSSPHNGRQMAPC